MGGQGVEERMKIIGRGTWQLAPYYGNLYALMVSMRHMPRQASTRTGWRSIDDILFGSIYTLFTLIKSHLRPHKGFVKREKMPFGINNPFPTSVASECKKAGKVSLRQPYT